MNQKKNEQNIEILTVNSWDEEEIVNLYKSAGWWKDSYKSEGIKDLIRGSFLFVVAFDKIEKKAVGMGRLISDKVSDAYIQDLVVLDKYRKKGIGSKILNKLVKYCKDKGIIWIGLIAEPDQDFFYLSNNFAVMKKYVPMKYKEGE